MNSVFALIFITMINPQSNDVYLMSAGVYGSKEECEIEKREQFPLYIEFMTTQHGMPEDYPFVSAVCVPVWDGMEEILETINPKDQDDPA